MDTSEPELFEMHPKDFTGRCDKCHAEPGTRFFDGFWVCRLCAFFMWKQLSLEALF